MQFLRDSKNDTHCYQCRTFWQWTRTSEPSLAVAPVDPIVAFLYAVKVSYFNNLPPDQHYISISDTGRSSRGRVYRHWRNRKLSTYLLPIRTLEYQLLHESAAWLLKIRPLIFSARDVFDFSKVPVRSFESHSYLSGVAAAILQWHLTNMNVIIKHNQRFYISGKTCKIMERMKFFK